MIQLNRIEFAAPASLENLAAALKGRMEQYRIPASVRKKTGIRSMREVQEPWLIVLCAPDTPGDPAVEEAIRRFAAEGRYNRILTLLADGKPEESFPGSLLREELADGTVIEHEPLAANIAGCGGRERMKRLETEKLRLIAPVLGVSFDDLMERRKRQRNRIMLAAAAAVILGAGGFLGYALSRMNLMAGQQKELTAQQERAEAEQRKAETERDNALEARARTAGVQARAALEDGDSELAMLICLEYLPEMDRVSELTGALKDALEARCAAGYVPVTARNAYKRTRGAELEDPGMYGFRKKEKEKENQPEKYVKIPPPDGLDYGQAEVSLKLCDWSPDYGYAVYEGNLKTGSASFSQCLWLYYPERPENNRFVSDGKGGYLPASQARILYDGTICAISAGRKAMSSCREWRIDPARGDAQLPVFDGGEETVRVMPFTLEYFWEEDGFEDMIIGLTRHAIEVYNPEPFTLRYSIRNEYTNSCNIAPDGSTFWVGFRAFVLPDGERVFVIGLHYVLDAETGELLFELEDNGLGVSDRYAELCSEGYLPVQRGAELCFWDLSERRIVREMKAGEKFCLAGPEDPETGRYSASRICAGAADALIVYEFRDTAETVPDSLPEQIALAERLLNGRTLTKGERNDNFLTD